MWYQQPKLRRTAVTVEVGDRDRFTLWRGQLLLAPLTDAVARAIVDDGAAVGPDAVMTHPQYLIIVVVPVEVGEGPSQSALGWQPDSAGFAKTHRFCPALPKWPWQKLWRPRAV